MASLDSGNSYYITGNTAGTATITLVGGDYGTYNQVAVRGSDTVRTNPEKEESPLKWLDRRVSEMRVAL